MNAIEQFKLELKEMQECDMGGLWSDCQVIDLDSGEILVQAGEDVTEDNLDRVLEMVLVHDGSIWTIIDNGIYVASEFELVG